MRNYKIKICSVCGLQYQSTNYQQKFCPGCSVIEGKKRIKRWNEEHAERKKGLERIWETTHRERHRLENVRIPESQRKITAKHHAKRRDLGFVLLNKPFNGSVGHHVDIEHVVHIPVELHKSVKHNVWTGENMNIINKLAKEFAELP